VVTTTKATSKDEYNSLRQEILNHQNNRLTVLGLALTATAALIASGMELKNPSIPLVAPFLLLAARIQIVQIHAGIQRISSYIRIILEDKNPELNWEKASYFVRSNSIKKNASVRNISSIKPIDSLLFFTGIASNILAIYLAFPDPVQLGFVLFAVTCGISVLWLGAWIYYSYTKVREWANMTAEEKEAKKWIEFRNSINRKTSHK